MRSTVRWAVALIAAILLTVIVEVEPSEIRYDLSSARGGFLGAEHADRHLRAAAADATRADPRVYASSLGANPDWIRDGALGVAIHRTGRAREGDAAGGGSDERSGPVPTPAPPSRMKPPRGERGDGDGDGAHRARESAANVGAKRPAMGSLADELARRDPTARRRREGSSFAIGTERAIRVDPPADARRPGWELTWHDEFDGDRLDLTKWTPRGNSSGLGLDERTRGGWGAQQWYDPRECVVSGGALAMRTRRRPNTSPDDFFHEPGTRRTSEAEYPFVSCWVDTLGSFSQTYGRVEVRARFPDQSCPGIRPRHWMLPDPSTGYGEACWPLGGEIDIAGAHGGGWGGPGSSPNAVESGYRFAPGGVCGASSEARGRHRVQNLNLDGEFHAFAVEWDKSSLRYYVDGVLTNVLDRLTVPIVPRWPFYLILNTEMSPFGMPDAMTECDGDFFHYVDYVRVYRRAEVAVHANVYRFLSLAAIGTLVTLSCAACVALRRNLDDDDDDEWASREEEERIRVKGLTPDMTERYFDHDSEDYYSAVGGARRRGTTAPKTAGHDREASRHGEALRSGSGSGSSGSDLRLLDAGSRRERRLGGEASVERRRNVRNGRRSAEERAPLVGGVGLRMPTDSTPSHSSHGSDGGEYGGNGGKLRWRRGGGSTSVFGSRPAFGPPARASEGSVGSGSSGAGSDDDAASFAPAAVRASAERG